MSLFGLAMSMASKKTNDHRFGSCGSIWKWSRQYTASLQSNNLDGANAAVKPSDSAGTPFSDKPMFEIVWTRLLFMIVWGPQVWTRKGPNLAPKVFSVVHKPHPTAGGPFLLLCWSTSKVGSEWTARLLLCQQSFFSTLARGQPSTGLVLPLMHTHYDDIV